MLPEPVKPDSVKAQYADSVLTVEIPKAEQMEPRRITIAAAE